VSTHRGRSSHDLDHSWTAINWPSFAEDHLPKEAVLKRYKWQGKTNLITFPNGPNTEKHDWSYKYRHKQPSPSDVAPTLVIAEQIPKVVRCQSTAVVVLFQNLKILPLLDG
jgi:hypothetical protein